MTFPNKWWLGTLAIAAACSTSSQEPIAEQSLTQYVNPFIGTGGHGHTYPGATMPFGMVQLSPDTRLEGWDGCSGYHYSDSIVYGFSHTHLSGTGIADYCDILLMPNTGEVHLNNGADGKPGYRSAFAKSDEQASPGYYAVKLADNDIAVELTTTPRVGMHRYPAPADVENLHVVLDLEHRDRLRGFSLSFPNDHTVVGKRISQSWANEQHVYFVAEFNQPFTGLVFESGAVTDIAQAPEDATKVALQFASTEAPLLAKVGISGVDIDGAQNNLAAELPGWDFDSVRQGAEAAWETQLAKVNATFANQDDQVNYYTALYHNSVVPNVWSDVDGRYRGMDQEIHDGDPAHPRYTIFSLWDTFRATHPFYSLTEPERTNDFVRTFLGMYQEGGKLPMWELAGNYTGTMIGYHAVPVIVDAYVKGLRDYDAELALEAMVSTAETKELGKEYYIELGYIPMNKEGESVSKTLEYGYNDWTISEFARMLGEESLANTFATRAQAYKNLFDPETGFMRGKQAHRWVHPFRPAEVNFNYTEANAWQYSFYVPQDVAGFAELYGGPEGLAKKLDALFTADSETVGRQQPDITGLIGQYAHGNEPSHHMAYLYTYLGQAHKTQAMVQRIMDEQYHNAPDGLSGNEDCGQMSAWYLFSALGFYPVCPGSDYYVIGSPRVQAADLPVGEGKTLKIRTSGSGDYISKVTWNGSTYDKTYLHHTDLIGGGTLEFTLSEEANEAWGREASSWPPSAITSPELMPVPALATGKRAFQYRDTVTLNHPLKGAKIYFTTDGSSPISESGEPTGLEYTLPFQVTEETTLKAVAVHPDLGASDIIETELLKIPTDWSISIANAYNQQYTAGGDQALIDHLRGGPDFKTGEWQGYYGVDMDVTIDLGSAKSVSQISPSFLQDENSWIFMPREVEVWVATEPGAWRSLGKKATQTNTREGGGVLEEFAFATRGQVRYIRVLATNIGECPEWHKGAGGKAWIFADEVVIE